MSPSGRLLALLKPRELRNAVVRGSFVGLVILLLYPISNYYTRLLEVVLSLAAAGALVIWLVSEKKRRRWTAAVTAALVMVAAIVHRPVTPEELRRQTAASWRARRGVHYVWGGEGWLGIDCSGLIRTGLIEAHLLQGIRHADPGTLSRGVRIWWHDETAKQMRDGYRGWTREIAERPSINGMELEPELLNQGDIAVTADGVHVLGYAGDGRWVEADPAGKVMEYQLPVEGNHWFKKPIKIMRWQMLE